MEQLYEWIERYFDYIVNFGVLFLEIIGVVIIIGTAIRCIGDMTGKKRGNYRIRLAKGISLALEFKLGGEVLRTVVARDFTDLAIIGCIIILRASLTFLLHWEIKNEKKEEKEEMENGELYRTPLDP